MSVELLQKNKTETSVLQSIIDWMDENFTDLNETAAAAAEKARRDGLVSGPLWNEIGAGTLRRIYKLRMNSARQNVVNLTSGRQKPVDNQNRPQNMDKVARGKLWFVPGLNEYFNIFDLTKKDLLDIADHYRKAMAGQLKASQTVGDVFNWQGIEKIREEIAADN